MKTRLIVGLISCIMACRVFGFVNFFYDGFSRPDHVDTWYEMKWIADAWGGVDNASYCSNDMWFVRPGTGEWNWSRIQPANCEFDECAFDVASGDGVTAQIDLEDWFVFSFTNKPPEVTNEVFDAHLAMAILNVPVTKNPWDLRATGLTVRARYDCDAGASTNLTIYLNRKSVEWSDGDDMFQTNVAFSVGATLALNFKAAFATVTYDGDILFDDAHGVSIADWTNWYAGYVVQNVIIARCNYFFDNAKIVGPGASFVNTFYDDFSGSELNSKKWFNTTGAAAVSNNMCKLTPGDWGWAGANLGMKADVDNPLRMDPSMTPLSFSVPLMDVEVTTTNASGPELMFKAEWYPERTHVNSWNYDNTSLSVETLVSAEGGVTNMDVFAYLYEEWGGSGRLQLFSSNDIAFVPGALFDFTIGVSNLTVQYNGALVGSDEHLIDDLPVDYPYGVFPALRVENFDTGRGSLYFGAVSAEGVPEPVCLAVALAMVLLCGRRGCR